MGDTHSETWYNLICRGTSMKPTKNGLALNVLKISHRIFLVSRRESKPKQSKHTASEARCDTQYAVGTPVLVHSSSSPTCKRGKKTNKLFINYFFFLNFCHLCNVTI